MSEIVVIVGSLDTKGEEFSFVKKLIEDDGLETLVVDFGVMGEPAFAPDVTRQEVCEAGDGNLVELSSGGRKDEAMATMARGLAVVANRLYKEGRLSGIIGMGGSGGTSLATTAMRELPVGVPKVMVSTVGGGDVSAYAGTKDISFIPSVVDVSGINRISRAIYANAAGSISGMIRTRANANLDKQANNSERPLLSASMFGNTTTAVDNAREILEKSGYEVLVFHATGSGGRTMEGLISDGYISGCLDITTTELADTVCGGVFDAGPERCLAASRAGIPTVIVPGCVDMANFGGIDSVPNKYRKRQLYEWNPDVTLLRTDVEENQRIGEMIAAAANEATAPTVVVIPRGGVSMLDSQGEQFWDPEADNACFESIRKSLRKDIPFLEDDHNINDPEFSSRTAKLLLEML